MDEILGESGPFDDLPGDSVDVLGLHPGAGRLDRRRLGFLEYGEDPPILRSRFSHVEGPGRIGAVAVQLAAKIDDDRVGFFDDAADFLLHRVDPFLMRIYEVSLFKRVPRDIVKLLAFQPLSFPDILISPVPVGDDRARIADRVFQGGEHRKAEPCSCPPD